MFIKNNTVYADSDYTETLKVVNIVPQSGFIMKISFNNGETKLFDFKPLLSAPAFAPLKDELLFKSVYIERGVPCWDNGNIDISPDYLYENGRDIEEVIESDPFWNETNQRHLQQSIDHLRKR